MGEKNILGRQRQLVVDSRGNLLAIVVHAADIPDREALVLLLDAYAAGWPRLLVVLADAGYRAEWRDELAREDGLAIRIVEKPAEQKGFVVQPLRWIVERSIAWLGRYRRLAKDYEFLPWSSESWIHLASIGRLLQRLRPDPTIEPPYRNQPRRPVSAGLIATHAGASS
jgi:putative transposase